MSTKLKHQKSLKSYDKFVIVSEQIETIFNSYRTLYEIYNEYIKNFQKGLVELPVSYAN